LKVTELALLLVNSLRYRYVHATTEASGDPLELLDLREMVSSLKTLQGIIHASKVAETVTAKGQALDLKKAAEKNVEDLLAQFTGEVKKRSRKP